MKVYTYDYNRQYQPSAPFVDVILSNDENGMRLEANAQIDTGADSSLVPLGLLQQISAAYEFTQTMVTADGYRQQVDLYAVRLELAGRTFYRTVVGVRGGDEVIIGRDVLNHLIMKLDGFAATTSIESD